jgi:hypothetical protein
LRLAEAERGSEIWFTAQPEFLLAADVLHSKGWLERARGPASSSGSQTAAWLR